MKTATVRVSGFGKIQTRDASQGLMTPLANLGNKVWAWLRLEAMITIARYGRTTRPRPQWAIAMTVLFVVTIPTA